MISHVVEAIKKRSMSKSELKEWAEAIVETTGWKEPNCTKEQAEAMIAHTLLCLDGKKDIDVFVVCKVVTIVFNVLGFIPPYKELCGIRPQLQPFNPFYRETLKRFDENGLIEIAKQTGSGVDEVEKRS